MPKIPTLHSGPVGIVDTPADIVAYLIRHSLKNPGFTSSLIEGDLLSFRKLEAEYPNRDDLVQYYSDKLEVIINKNLPGGNYTVEITTEDKPNSNDYSMSIAVLDGDGLHIIKQGKIVVQKDDIIINFDTAY